MTARGLINLACLLCCAIVIHGIDLEETSNGESNEEGPPGSDPGGMATGFACEGSELEIHCSNGTTISIIHANYGRLDENICNDNVMPVDITQRWERKCISNQSLDIVRQRCEDTVSCGVLASKDVFGGICDSKSSYLEVDYVCKDGFERVGTETLTTSQITTPTEDRSTVNIDHVTTSAPVLDGNFCPAVTFRSVHWPATLAGTVAVQPCPYNPSSSDGQFTRWSCSSTTSQWIGHPDLSQCRSRMVIEAQSKMKTMKVGFSLMSMNEKLESLLTLSRQKDLIGGDLTSMMSTIKDILDESDLNLNVVDGRIRNSFAQNVSKAVLDISSNFLGDNIAVTWLDLPDVVQVETATRLMSAVEDGAYLLASTIDANQSIVNVASNIVVEVRSYLGARDQVGSRKISFPPPVDPSDGSASWIRTSGSISISRSSFVQNTSDPIPVVFSLFNHLDKWLKTSDTSGGKNENSVTYDSNELEGPSSGFVNTKIISASVGKRRRQKLKEPMRYVLEHNQMVNVSSPACVFWNYSEKTYQGDWSSEGCRVVTSNDSHTTCECDHLTNFAVLMSVTPHKMSAAHQFSLSVITYFGCLVSLVCLVLAFATFQIFKNLQCDRNTIHKHLTLNLFLGELLFLFGIGLTSSPVVCSVVAGFLHYFFLTAFAWMCLEGVQLYVLLIEVFEAEKSRIKWYYASAYGIPAIIVAITAAVAHDGYGTADHCWLSVTNGVIWAFVGPVVIIVAVNTVMLCIALYTMCRHAATAAACKMRQKTRAENIGSWIKGAFVLVILLGTTWVFGLFYINQHSIFMAYVFTIFNSLQGFFIFVFHCLMSEKVQKEYKRWIQRNHWLPEKFRVKYGGASASAVASSGAANNSTSSGTNYIFRLLRNRKRENSLSGSSFQKIHTRSKNSKDNVLIVISPPKDDSSGKSKRLTYSSTTSDSARQTDSTGFPSQDYDDGMTEDPSGYLDPALTRVDENEFGFRDYDTAGEMSAIEGSVVFMDYATSGSNRDPHKPERK